MFSKLVIRLGFCLLLVLAASSCVGESSEVAAAKAHYINARAELVEAQVAQTEAQTRQVEEEIESTQQIQEANMALRREQTQKLVQLACTLLPWMLGFSGVALCVAVSGIVGRHLIEADRQRQEDRARALSEERRLLQVWVTAARHPVTSPGSGGDGHKPAAIVDMSRVDILQLLQRLREQYPV
ncbi:MAG TPA: hypothetical protein VMY40_02955 [Anaerolineae bacterium]|nr:hypothetical protein [Anaerolineae bacterium]